MLLSDGLMESLLILTTKGLTTGFYVGLIIFFTFFGISSVLDIIEKTV